MKLSTAISALWSNVVKYGTAAKSGDAKTEETSESSSGHGRDKSTLDIFVEGDELFETLRLLI